MTQIIVPTDTAGVNIIRGIGIFGHATSDHCEIKYENVRVPIENTLGLVGQGHQAAQDRLGAGRVYHCMNSIARCGAPLTSWSSAASCARCTADC